MRFWDSSAIIPLCLKEPMSETVRRLMKADEDIVVWWTTKVECLSAVARRRREGVLSDEAESNVGEILSVLSTKWPEILHHRTRAPTGRQTSGDSPAEICGCISTRRRAHMGAGKSPGT